MYLHFVIATAENYMWLERKVKCHACPFESPSIEDRKLNLERSVNYLSLPFVYSSQQYIIQLSLFVMRFWCCIVKSCMGIFLNLCSVRTKLLCLFVCCCRCCFFFADNWMNTYTDLSWKLPAVSIFYFVFFFANVSLCRDCLSAATTFIKVPWRLSLLTVLHRVI